MAKSKKITQKKNKNENMKYNKKELTQDSAFTLEFSKVVKCVIAVAIVLGCAYLLSIYLTERGKRESVKVQEAHIQYDIILAGESFSKKEEEYVVLYFKSDDMSVYSEVLSTYSEDKEKPRLYKCYTDEALNKKFIATEVSENPSQPQDLRVKENTLIHFKNHEVFEVIEGSDEINSYLENLS